MPDGAKCLQILLQLYWISSRWVPTRSNPVSRVLSTVWQPLIIIFNVLRNATQSVGLSKLLWTRQWTLQFHKRRGKLLTSSATVSFLRTLLQCTALLSKIDWKFQSGHPASRLKFELMTFWIRGRSAKRSAATFYVVTFYTASWLGSISPYLTVVLIAWTLSSDLIIVYSVVTWRLNDGLGAWVLRDHQQIKPLLTLWSAAVLFTLTRKKKSSFQCWSSPTSKTVLFYLFETLALSSPYISYQKSVWDRKNWIKSGVLKESSILCNTILHGCLESGWSHLWNLLWSVRYYERCIQNVCSSETEMSTFCVIGGWRCYCIRAVLLFPELTIV